MQISIFAPPPPRNLFQHFFATKLHSLKKLRFSLYDKRSLRRVCRNKSMVSDDFPLAEVGVILTWALALVGDQTTHKVRLSHVQVVHQSVQRFLFGGKKGVLYGNISGKQQRSSNNSSSNSLPMFSTSICGKESSWTRKDQHVVDREKGTQPTKRAGRV